MTQSRYKLVVFDWDGTLMDSEARIVNCLEAAVADLGLPTRERGAYSNIIGLGLREAIDALYPGMNETDQARFVEAYRYHFINVNDTPMPLFEGAMETVLGLANEGYLLAVATGKGRNGLNKVLSQTGLDKVFHSSRCADECFSKPHPAMLEQILDELGAWPREAVMVGDTEYDMQMAANAGVDAIAVHYGVHSPGRLSGHGPVAGIDDIRELPALIREAR